MCVCVCVCVCMCVVLRDFFGGRTLKRAIKLDSYTPILRLTNSQIWPATLFQQELYRTHTPHVVCMVLYPGYAMAISNVCNACGQTMMSHYTHITGSVNNIRRPHIVVEYCCTLVNLEAVNSDKSVTWSSGTPAIDASLSSTATCCDSISIAETCHPAHMHNGLSDRFCLSSVCH